MSQSESQLNSRDRVAPTVEPFLAVLATVQARVDREEGGAAQTREGDIMSSRVLDSVAKKARVGGGLDASVTVREVPQLGDAIWCCVDPLDGETLFLCTHYAIFTLSPTGILALLAGGSQGFEDGQVSPPPAAPSTAPARVPKLLQALTRGSQGRDARFNIPRGIVVDKDNNLLLVDCNNHAIRRVSRSGEVTTVAGNGEAGFADGLGTAARFSHPFGAVLDQHGFLVVADFNNNAVRKVSPAGQVTTLAGNGEVGFADGQGVAARFNAPQGVAIDSNGNIYVSDSHNHAIRKLVPSSQALREAMVSVCTVSTIAGGAISEGGRGKAGFCDGDGKQALFDRPAGLAVDGNSTLVVADSMNHRLRSVDSDGRVRTVAGGSEAGHVNGSGLAVRFREPCVAVFDAHARLVVIEKEQENLLRVCMSPSFSPPRELAGVGGVGHADAIVGAMASLLDNALLSDVSFLVDGEYFPAHRCVLAARSQYFRGLLTHGMQGGHASAAEDRRASITIHDVSASAFRVLLRFIYTGSIDAIAADVKTGVVGHREAAGGVVVVLGEEAGGGGSVTLDGIHVGQLLQVPPPRIRPSCILPDLLVIALLSCPLR